MAQNSTQTTPSETTSITYATSIKPILDAKCTKCHSGANPKHGIDLTTYENVKAAVGHHLYCTVSGGNCPEMPPLGPKLTTEEVQMIDTWIKNGTPN